jgi:hypothetical protein
MDDSAAGSSRYRDHEATKATKEHEEESFFLFFFVPLSSLRAFVVALADIRSTFSTEIAPEI